MAEKTEKMFSIKERERSFGNALKGIITVIKSEANFRIQLFIFTIVVVAGIILHISAGGWIAVIIASGFVFASECFNTAIEYMGDSITKSENKYIKNAKDVAAAGVLISALISFVTGIIVFIPAIIRFLGL